MSIARDGSLPIKVLKDLHLLRPWDSIDMQVLADLKSLFFSEAFPFFRLFLQMRLSKIVSPFGPRCGQGPLGPKCL